MTWPRKKSYSCNSVKERLNPLRNRKYYEVHFETAMLNCDLVGKEFETTSFLNKLTNIDSLAMILLDCKLSHSGMI